jgi:hypothetical protein
MASTITTITGLQNLPNLQVFYADFNGLQTVDLSGLTSLTDVDVSDCVIPGTSTKSLTSVNLTGCTAITELRVDDSDFSANGLSSIIGLSDLINLEFLDIDQCGLSGTIDVSGFPALDFIDVGGNVNVTEVIITGSQPIIEFVARNCNFSANGLSSIVGLSDLTSLAELDINGCGLSGTIDVSGFPALGSIDVGSNSLTEVIITESQPIGNFDATDCNFTQEKIDDILVVLSNNGESGNIQLTGSQMGIPSNEVGVPAIRTLAANGWGFNFNNYASNFISTVPRSSQGETCTDIGTDVFEYNLYIYTGSVVQSGSYVYGDQTLVYADSDGWRGISGSNDAFLVSGSGLIVSQSTCV